MFKRSKAVLNLYSARTPISQVEINTCYLYLTLLWLLNKSSASLVSGKFCKYILAAVKIYIFNADFFFFFYIFLIIPSNKKC
jgi:hypothetical protein